MHLDDQTLTINLFSMPSALKEANNQQITPSQKEFVDVRIQAVKQRSVVTLTPT